MTHTCDQFDPANPPVQWVRDGYVTDVLEDGGVVQYPRMVKLHPKWLDLPCQYSNHRTDPDCPDSCPRKTT